MTAHKNLPYIQHIIDSINKIEQSLKGFTKETFIKNDILVDATVRRIEIIGEAVKHISDEVKNEYKNVEWKKIAGTRDILIHAYFSIDLDILWKIVEKDFPPLKKHMLIIQSDIKKTE